jgi:hypothetical protein
VSLGYVIRTCRCGASPLTLMAKAPARAQSRESCISSLGERQEGVAQV